MTELKRRTRAEINRKEGDNMPPIEKVVLPREVAEAIERYLQEFDKETLIRMRCEVEGEWSGEYVALDKVDIMTLAAALVNGYEIEQSPEERLREYND
jgi:hypothetical protein